MNRTYVALLAIALLLSALSSCRMQTHDYFGEAMEQSPDFELPKSEAMEVDPDTLPKYEIADTVKDYDDEQVIKIPADGEHEAGELVVKYRIYEYAEKIRHVAVVSVENHSEQPLTITIKGNCENTARGDHKMVTRTFQGFAAGWQNYFIFDPDISFDQFTYELTYEIYEGKTYGQNYQNLHWSGLRLNNAAQSLTEQGCVRVHGLFYYDYAGSELDDGFGGGYVLFNEYDEVLFCETNGTTFTKVQEADPNSWDGHGIIMPHLGKDEGFMWDDLDPKRNNVKAEESNYEPTESMFEVAYGIFAFNGMYDNRDEAPPLPPHPPISDIW